MGDKKFPEGFLWGAATSSMQTEGDITGSDWAEADRNGEVPPIGKADEHYWRYEDDFDLAKKLHHNASRFSVEWARVEPEEGKFDERELAHYRQVAIALKARGIEPMVTFWHFSLPLWFSRSGSFGRKDAPQIFARYAAKVAEAMGTEVHLYLTQNEPLVWLGEQGVTVHSSPGTGKPLEYIHFFYQLIRAHKAAYDAVKRVNPGAQIGVAKHQFSFVGMGMLGKVYAAVARYFWNRIFLDAIAKHQDFVGIQFYQRLFFWQTAAEDAAQPKSDIGWQIHPEAIYDTLVEAKRYKVPIYITENGIADAQDQWRADFIKKSLEAVHRAIADGADVRGYFHWSLLDNYELSKGYTMRFGLIAVDQTTQKRTVRQSAKVYAEICAKNALA